MRHRQGQRTVACRAEENRPRYGARWQAERRTALAERQPERPNSFIVRHRVIIQSAGDAFGSAGALHKVPPVSGDAAKVSGWQNVEMRCRRFLALALAAGMSTER